MRLPRDVSKGTDSFVRQQPVARDRAGWSLQTTQYSAFFPRRLNTTPTVSSSIMPLTVIREAPSEARYTPIVEFQSTTPASFAAPVLHSLHRNCCVTISRSQAALIPAFRTTPAGENENADEDMNVEGVDIWVTSEFDAPCAEVIGKKHI